MELKVTKEKVLKAAKDCKDAEKVLRTLFPEVFKGDKYSNLSLSNINNFIQVRIIGEYTGKGFYLSELYNWEIVKDRLGIQVLIPTKKEVK